MALTTTTYTTSNERNYGVGFEGTIRNVKALAATTYTKGDFVTVDTAGRAALNTTNDEEIDGIVTSNVDNSEGANDDVMVPILVRGTAWVDVVYSNATGDWGEAFAVGTQCSVHGDGGTTAATGQAVAAATGTNRIFTSLATQAVIAGTAAATAKRKGLMLFRGSDKFI
jgi:hypothetical protein